MTTVTQRSKPLILAADDDDLSREIIEQVLAAAGFDVIIANDGATALALFLEHHPDLVLLDVMMPTLNGFAVCEKIRADDSNRYTPIIMLTGLDDVASVTRSLQGGATDFITKPISWPLFTERVRYALRGSQMAMQLHENQERLEAAQRIAKMGHFEFDPQSERFLCSGYMHELLGINAQQPASDLQTFLTHVHPDHRAAFANAIKTAATSQTPVSLDHRVINAKIGERAVYTRAEAVLDRNNQPVKVMGIMHDITERLETETRLNYVTHYDDVTGLPNRTLFQDRLRQAMAEADRRKELVGIIHFDLDRFKDINESFGHDSGNAMLKLVAERIGRVARKCDSLARFGADEFGIIIGEMDDLADAVTFSSRVLTEFEKPFLVADQELYISASLGVTIYPLDGKDPDTLFKNADTALHRAKESGRNNFQFYQGDMNVASRKRLTMETRLRQALKKEEFLLCFQPQVHLLEHKIHGVEALIRWKDGKNGIVPPLDFIPVLEDSGLIVQVGEWVLRTACQWIRQWQEQGLDLSISVNVSARQFNDPHLADTIINILDETKVPPNKLELELTESTLMQNEQRALDVLNVLKSTGVQLAIDDFGTGYSSLSYLKKLPVDYLKVDKSFVMGMSTDHDDLVIVRSTVDLAHNLGLKVVAEGIENLSAMKLLQEMKCEIAQGFFIARPLFGDQFSAWLKGYGQQAPAKNN